MEVREKEEREERYKREQADIARKKQVLLLPCYYPTYLTPYLIPYLIPTLPYLTLPYLTLPYLTLPYLTLPYLTSLYLLLSATKTKRIKLKTMTEAQRQKIQKTITNQKG